MSRWKWAQRLERIRNEGEKRKAEYLVLHGGADAAQGVDGAGQLRHAWVNLAVILTQTRQSSRRFFIQVLIAHVKSRRISH